MVYADDLKSRLLNYLHSTVAFSEAEVDFNVVTWNRCVGAQSFLHHGSELTLRANAESSCCMALPERARPVCAEALPKSSSSVSRSGESDSREHHCHQLTQCSRYRYGKIVEINSHSLFSKWFSESGKLVQKLFSTVNEMVDDENAFVVVMIGHFLAQPVLTVLIGGSRRG